MIHFSDLIELLHDSYFEFVVRSFIYLHFFGAGFWRFILFLCLGYVFLILPVPCHFVIGSAHLKKQAALPVFMEWLCIGKKLH